VGRNLLGPGTSYRERPNAGNQFHEARGGLRRRADVKGKPTGRVAGPASTVEDGRHLRIPGKGPGGPGAGHGCAEREKGQDGGHAVHALLGVEVGHEAMEDQVVLLGPLGIQHLPGAQEVHGLADAVVHGPLLPEDADRKALSGSSLTSVCLRISQLSYEISWEMPRSSMNSDGRNSASGPGPTARRAVTAFLMSRCREPIARGWPVVLRGDASGRNRQNFSQAL